MKYSITLTPSEWVELTNILIAQEVQATRDAADPDLACIKAHREYDAALAKELREILYDRLHFVEEEEEA